MDAIIIFCAKYLIYFAIVLFVFAVGYWLYRSRKWWFISQIVASGALAYITARIIKLFYYNPRPFVTDHVSALFKHAPDNGFPSDHVLLLATLAFVSWRVSRTLGMTLLVLAFIVGVARVLAHVHHSVDIAGSFVISLIAVFLVNIGFLFLAKRRKNRLSASIPGENI
jgi:undecaprenyl-diphosphatase